MKIKKIILIVALILGSQIIIFAQTGHSCAPFDQKRNISGMKEILERDGIYYDNLRLSYADAVNTAVGENIIQPTKEGMDYVLSNTKFLDETFIVPSDYFNGVRYGDSISFTTLLGQPSDSWAVFNYEGIDYVYAKVSCMNPQKIIKVPQKKETVPPVVVVEKKITNELVDRTNEKAFEEEKVPEVTLLKKTRKGNKMPTIKVLGIVISSAAILAGLILILKKLCGGNDNNYSPPQDTGTPVYVPGTGGPMEPPGSEW